MATVPEPRWWQWPTVLSLDAPAVAVAWQFLVARVFGLALPTPEAAVLAASVWLAYAADRWLEARRLDPGAVQTERHRHYGRYRRTMAVVWILVLAGDVTLAVTRLTARELRAGAILLVAVLLYVLSHQWVHREQRGRVPKEFCVAALITAGVALFPTALTGQVHAPARLVLVLFFALCFANCAFISAWEWEVDLSHGQTSLARQFPGTRAIVREGVAGLAGTAGLTGLLAAGSVRAAAGCVAASALALALVDRAEPALGRRGARVLADLVLLTPLAPLLWP